MTTLIAGLGNPGRRFHETRHNLGFRVVDELAERLGATWRRARRGTVLLAASTRDRKTILLVKPQTFMNSSGGPIAELVRARRLPRGRLWVVVDDLALPFGRLRLRERGSSGGHRGLDSIIAGLGTEAFPRLRIGIAPRETPARFDGAAYVLGRLDAAERKAAPGIINAAADALLEALDRGFPKTMSRWNRKT